MKSAQTVVVVRGADLKRLLVRRLAELGLTAQVSLLNLTLEQLLAFYPHVDEEHLRRMLTGFAGASTFGAIVYGPEAVERMLQFRDQIRQKEASRPPGHRVHASRNPKEALREGVAIRRFYDQPIQGISLS